MKRQRGRGRKPPGHHPNRNFESSGPDLKIRGSAAHIYEKYLQLARDATSSGDRVMAENYLQHAEHYFRILRAMQPQHVSPQFEQRFDQSYDLEQDEGEDGDDGEIDGEEDGEAAASGDEQRQQQRGPRPYQDGGRGDGQRQQRQHRDDRRHDRHGQDRGDRQGQERQERANQDRQPYRERAEAGFSGQVPAAEGGGEGEFAGQDGGEGDGFRGRRRRRSRFRPGGGEGGDRAPREGGGEQPNVEGFGDSAPAFLGGD